MTHSRGALRNAEVLFTAVIKHFAPRYLAPAALLNMAIALHAGPIIVDQQNLGPVSGTNGGVLFGQSFTPTLSRIDAIQLLMGDDGTDVVKILNGLAGSDGLGGAVIGTSDPVSVHTSIVHELIQFDFPLGVTLMPGETYVALLSHQDGSGVDGVSFSDDLYSGGQFLEQGFSLNSFSRDMIFSEGLTPEPAPIALVALGLAAFLILTRALVRSDSIRGTQYVPSRRH